MAHKDSFDDVFDIYETPLNCKSDIPTKNIDVEDLDREVFKRVCRELDDEDKDNLVYFGGYTIKEYQEGEPDYYATVGDHSGHSVTCFTEAEVSLIVEWPTREGKRQLPLQFTISSAYKGSGGYC